MKTDKSKKSVVQNQAAEAVELSMDELDEVAGGRGVAARPQEPSRNPIPTEHFSFGYTPIK